MPCHVMSAVLSLSFAVVVVVFFVVKLFQQIMVAVLTSSAKRMSETESVATFLILNVLSNAYWPAKLKKNTTVDAVTGGLT